MRVLGKRKIELICGSMLGLIGLFATPWKVTCREPAWGIPPMAKVMRKGAWQNAKAGSGLRNPPGFSQASTPKVRVCLLYHVMLSTYSSGINRGLSPHHLFLEKVNLELLDNKSPGHIKSVSIQKPLWWLSSLADRFVRTLTAVHVIVYSLRERQRKLKTS